MDIDWALGHMPQKVFDMKTKSLCLRELVLPINLTGICLFVCLFIYLILFIAVFDALNRVLRLPSVASKRYLTNKVDNNT
jgi:phosphoribosylformylglycinamidine synthase